jgi:DNA-binding NarL/FixJ family response regulator
VELLRVQPCDVVLLDISMPGKDGLSLLKDIRCRWPRIAVVMLTMHPDEQYATRALRAGAAGYLNKSSVPEDLTKAIRRVSSGARYVSPALANCLAASFVTHTDKPLHESLSDREFAVLCRIGAGKSVSHIAEELFLSSNTVSTYRARLLAKLKLNNTVELIRYVVANGLNAGIT